VARQLTSAYTAPQVGASGCNERNVSPPILFEGRALGATGRTEVTATPNHVDTLLSDQGTHFQMYIIKIRSFALATFVIARGIQPIDAVLIDGKPVFRFPPEADAATDEYHAVKQQLDTLARTAQPVEVAR